MLESYATNIEMILICKIDYQLSASDFGYSKIEIEDLAGGTPKENAEIILNIFNGKEIGAKRNVVIANAALALYSSNYSDNLLKCKLAAEESIMSGKALEKLNKLKEFGETK